MTLTYTIACDGCPSTLPTPNGLLPRGWTIKWMRFSHIGTAEIPLHFCPKCSIDEDRKKKGIDHLGIWIKDNIKGWDDDDRE